jgi:hypothetical protein
VTGQQQFRNFTQAKLKRRMEEIEANISRYLAELDTADRQEPAAAKSRSVRLHEKIAAMKEQMNALKDIEARLEATGETQISLTDQDARSMITRGAGIVGYNVFSDAKWLAQSIFPAGLAQDEVGRSTA